ncbi:MAG: [FeFe] hydrogenase H-cluster maturation GTPase HydF [Polyangia bacterium]|jgi:[FeFe] hydrogenase H-cluster maturation GTPase HydF|nr:[FeFe] hydrogenase H-cluster maturation GTPase HydF [Polyangia bacterium]
MKASRGLRLHIALLGRRNVGKSSLLNALTRQDVSIVSTEAGTTTDPVEKPMELLPLGPVLFIDTAGIDDEGALGAQRVARTHRVLDRTDLGLVIFTGAAWGSFEDELVAALAERGAPVLAVANQVDLQPVPPELMVKLRAAGLVVVSTSATRGDGLPELREALLESAPGDFVNAPPLLHDLVPPGEVAVLVIPVDKEAPKGRIILPQVQAIRDLLDHDALALVVQDRGLAGALASLGRPPALVVTDSQAFSRVAELTPETVPMTSFSILMARHRGDLQTQAAGALAIDGLRSGDRVLVAESCTHHPIEEDIGRVKLPGWIRERSGAELAFDTVAGRDFPDDLSPYRLVIQCGGCMTNRREVLSRILRCREAGVPITNYGVAIAHCLGILERALAPFRLRNSE